MAKSKKPTLESLQEQILSLQAQIQQLATTYGNRVFIKPPPQDGQSIARDFKASGSVRPANHTVRLQLFCMQNSETSDWIDASVQSDGSFTDVGPFKKNGNLLSAGAGARLTAESRPPGSSPSNPAADTDQVVSLTLT